MDYPLTALTFVGASLGKPRSVFTIGYDSLRHKVSEQDPPGTTTRAYANTDTKLDERRHGGLRHQHQLRRRQRGHGPVRHYARTGNWPRKDGGRVHGAPDEKWQNIDMALRQGLRGFPGGWSLPQLLSEYRGVRNHVRLPRLTIKQILAWADAHRRSTGQWPRVRSGAIRQAPGETWLGVNLALTRGMRGLQGGSSLAELLAKYRKVRNSRRLAKLSVRQILTWADAYKHRTGRWPTATSGAIAGTVGETWHRVDKALRRGTRGLRNRSSLSQLLAKHRGATKPMYKPPLCEADIVRWAKAYRRRTGKWPTRRSGPIAEARGESWLAVCDALRVGYRGLRPGESLRQVCAAAAN